MEQYNQTDINFPILSLNGIYRGVVEDNQDPEKQGRCRIRVYGIHTATKIGTSETGIPTADIPWADPAIPIYGGISKVGIYGIPNQGANVYVFFQYGNPMKPVYFAAAPGTANRKPMIAMGFNDPGGSYPDDETRFEPDWNDGESAYSQYGETFVIRSKCGHYIELSDMPGNETITIKHGKNSSFIQITADGDIKIVPAKDKDYNEKIRGNKRTYVKGDISVDNMGGKYGRNSFEENISIGSSSLKTIGGSAKTTSAGKYNVEGNGMFFGSRKEFEQTSGQNMDITAGTDLTLKAGGPLVGDSKLCANRPNGNVTVEAKCLGTVNVKGQKKVDIKSKMDVLIEGTNNQVKISSNRCFQAKGNTLSKLESDNQTQISGQSQVRVRGGMIYIN